MKTLKYSFPMIVYNNFWWQKWAKTHTNTTRYQSWWGWVKNERKIHLFKILQCMAHFKTLWGDFYHPKIQHSTSTCRPCLNTNFCEGVVCIQIWQGCWWWGGFLLIPLMMIDTDTPSLLVPSSSLSKAWLHLMIIIDTTSSTINTPPQLNLKFHTQPVLIMITISKTAPPSRSPPQGVRDGAYMAGTVLRRHATLVVCSLNDDYSCLRWLFNMIIFRPVSERLLCEMTGLDIWG